MSKTSKKSTYDYPRYRKYILSAEWLIKKSWLISTYLKRGWDICCAKCGDTQNLHIHHLSYENLYNEKLNDLMILCNECHKQRHQNKEVFDKEILEVALGRIKNLK